MIAAIGYFLLLVVAVYLILLLLFLASILFLPGLKPINQPILLSIIVPFRNERPFLEDSIKRFEKLIKSTTGAEVIFINDHSTDISRVDLDELFEDSKIRVTHLDQDKQKGKKYAILHGVQEAQYPWVLTLDIDTSINGRMLREMMADPPTDSACAVIPIKPRKSSSLLSKLFDLEFMVLQAVGSGSVLLKRPLLANGACFFVNRDVYLQIAKGRDDWDISGGDDVFAMFAISRAQGANAVSVYIAREPLAEARFPEGASNLFLQRVRWVAKTTKVKNSWYAFVAWLALGANITFVVLWGASLFADLYPIVWVYSCLKWIGEFALITWGVLYFRRSDALLAAIPGLFIYPFYLCVLVLAAIVIKPRWKD